MTLYICPVCGEGTTNNILHLHSQPEHKNERVDVIELAPCKALVEAARNAHEFISSVSGWTGQEDDQTETLDELDRCLAPFEEGNDGR